MDEWMGTVMVGMLAGFFVWAVGMVIWDLVTGALRKRQERAEGALWLEEWSLQGESR